MATHPGAALLLSVLLLAGCISPGPAPGPVLLAESGAPDGVLRWFLDPDGDLLAVDASDGVAASLTLRSARDFERTGLRFGLLDADLADRVFGAAADTTLLTEVPPGTPAWLAGLRRGDRLLAVDGTPPGSPAAVVEHLSGIPPGTEIVMEVAARDGTHRFAFPAEEDVGADAGIDLGILFGSEGNRRRWSTWGLAGILWGTTRVWWETEERSPSRWMYAETGWFLVAYTDTPEWGRWLRVLWVIPIPLP